MALQTIEAQGGIAKMSQICVVVEKRLNGPKLSAQGKAS
jgi:hypothetical protein